MCNKVALRWECRDFGGFGLNAGFYTGRFIVEVMWSMMGVRFCSAIAIASRRVLNS